jgi:hypothetical protein
MVADDNGKTVEQVARDMVDHCGADAVLVLRERAEHARAIELRAVCETAWEGRPMDLILIILILLLLFGGGFGYRRYGYGGGIGVGGILLIILVLYLLLGRGGI